MDDGPITFNIDLIPCELDAAERYARELPLVRYLAWLVEAIFDILSFVENSFRLFRN
jgi:hypothetical protein